MAAQLTLQPETTAAGIARRWVKEQLTERARPDLLDSAVLGVSELVTNALLHVRGTIGIRIVQAGGHIRIEVYDDSTHPPHNRPVADVETLGNPPTIGRGLQIVDAISSAWGVDYEGDGKCVWFHPMSEGATRDSHASVLPMPMPDDPPELPGTETVDVELIDVPVHLLTHYRVRFRDLRRELTLIALDADETSNVGDRLDAVAKRLEAYRSVGAEAQREVEDALSAGLDRTNLHYVLPLAAVPGIVELHRLIREADAFCRERRLLTLAAGPQEREMRSWFLNELIAQASGAPPTPWPGEFVVSDPDPLH